MLASWGRFQKNVYDGVDFLHLSGGFDEGEE
jgi:hypothetical protein